MRWQVSAGKVLIFAFVLVSATMPLLVSAVTMASETNDQQEEGARSEQGSQLMTYDETLGEIAKQHPGFGGFRRDSDGGLTVFGTRQLDEASIRASLIDSGLIPPELSSAQLRFVGAQFELGSLLDWRSTIRANWDRFPGMAVLGVSESRNRIRLRVEANENVGPVESMLAQLGIPRGAVSIEVTGPFRRTATLSDAAVTMEGGWKINNPGHGNCSLGFVAEKGSVDGYVTAGHCSRHFGDGTVSGDDFHQPTQSGTQNHLGDETVNAPFFTTSPCPAMRECSYSDALFIEDAGIIGPGQLGWIARTTNSNGSKTIESWPDEHFEIVAWSNTYSVNDDVNTVGFANGWNDGLITEICEDGDDGFVVTLCMIETDITLLDGDSGAPLFSRTGVDDEVVLHGIATGTISGAGYFSDIGWIMYELGGTWTVCYPGNSC